LRVGELKPQKELIMAKMKLDFTNAGEGGFETLPKGKYNVIVVDVTEKTSSNGNPMMNVKTKVTEGKYKNRNLFVNLVCTEKALFRVKAYLEACGIEVPKSMLEVDFDETIGKELTLEIDQRTYKDKEGNDKTSEDVKKFLPLEELDESNEEMDEDELPI